jgi:regulator of sigma E protease
VLGFAPLLLLLVPSLVAAAVARGLAARALGMKGVGWFFNGSIGNDAAGTSWRSAVVAFASVLASYSLPAFLFAAAFIAGANPVWSTEVTVLPDKPAEAAGMMSGDRVVSIGGTRVAVFADLAPQIAHHGGEPVDVVVLRGSDEMHFTVIPQGLAGRAVIGVKPRGTIPRGALASVAMGFTEPVRVLAAIWRGMANMLVGEQDPQLMGPVGIVRQAADATPSRLGYLLSLVATMITYVWPFTALAAIVTAPRRRR